MEISVKSVVEQEVVELAIRPGRLHGHHTGVLELAEDVALVADLFKLFFLKVTLGIMFH